MKVVLDAGALGDLERIRRWIERDNPEASRKVLIRLFETFDLLAALPEMGRAGLDEGTREWAVPGLPTSWSTKLIPHSMN
jgi:toxin ParE1/3/4